MKKADIQIIEQPQNASAENGETVSTTVVAEGDGLSYTWYYKKANGTKFYKSGLNDSNTYSTVAVLSAGTVSWLAVITI